MHGKVADELLPVLLEALYYALASLGDGALASASRKTYNLWPILFSLIWKELGLGEVRYDPSTRPRRAEDGEVSRGGDPDGGDRKEGGYDEDEVRNEDELSQGEVILRWGSRIVCLLVAVPVHWTLAGAGSQIVSDEHALALVHSPVLDDKGFRVFAVTARCEMNIGG